MNKSNQSKSAGGCFGTASRVVLCMLVGFLCALGLRAQSPAEHAAHHPGQAGGTMPAAGAMPDATPGGGSGMGGMMEGMGEMMKNMGKPPPKQLYPTLMALPELSPEQRIEVEHAAAERMQAGTKLMGHALDMLNAGAQSGDYAAMHEAMTGLREGVAELESGITARRALAEGRAPRQVALAWFKQEMSLAAPVVSAETHGIRGLSVLHLFTMVLLVAFAFAMLAMYFFKMRRAAALFGRIEPDKKSPPPGSSPPLEGGGASPDKSAKPAEPPAEKPPTPAPPAKAS